LACLVVCVVTRQSEAARPADKTTEVTEPPATSWLQQASNLLVRDPAVQKELHLRPVQVKEVETLLEKADRVLWGLRDLPPTEGSAKAKPVIGQFDRALTSVLDAWQLQRLEQIVLQAGGMESLVRSEAAAGLALNEDQQKKISRITAETRKALGGLGVLREDGTSADKLDRIARTLRTQERQNVLLLLTEAQRRQWVEMLGRPFDTSRLMGTAFKASELKTADAWINTNPLTLAGLRGKVVILNFYTYSCANCRHNFPVYKRWYEAYNDKGVVILGIHTPETQEERNLEKVRLKASENGLAWPILVDNSQANWNAWANRVWPSVYLIDKRGNIRSWWYGELNWKKTPGEDIMRGHIDKLLAEPGPASQPAASRATAN
jgi:thiol-disulfide isomerase/thioredoxin